MTIKTEKIKILIVLDYINHNSGVSSVVMNYYKNMNHARVQMDFLLYESPEGSLRSLLENHNSQIYTSGHPTKLGIQNYQKKIRHFFEEHRGEYQVVHVHIPNAAFVVLRYAKKANVGTRIIHSHNSRGADELVKKFRNYILNKWGIFYANQYFACSRSAGEYLFGKKGLRKTIIINNAIDQRRFAYDPAAREKIRKELGITEELVLGHVGRFNEQKNHSFLIEIVEELKKRDVSFCLLLLGGGELEKEIRKLVRAGELEKKVHFVGVAENVKEYMDAMDLFLLPSLYEGLPCVCVEAQANGLPCFLASNITKEVCLSKEVHFLEITDPTIWAHKIMDYIRMEKEDRNQQKSDNKVLNEYDIVIQARRLEERYLSYGNCADSDVYL